MISRFVALVFATLLSNAAVASLPVEKIRANVVHLVLSEGEGSAFFVGNDGLLVTAAHVVAAGGEDGRILFADHSETEVEFLGFCPDGQDFAAFRLGDMTLAPAGLTIRSGLSAAVAEAVFSVGNPYPLYPALVGGGWVAAHRESHGVIVHTAPVSSGSSGGPLLDESGAVVGVVVGRLTDQLDYSEYASGFNIALDLATLGKFMQNVLSGELADRRGGHLEFLRYPLETLVTPSSYEGRFDADSDRLPGGLEFAKGFSVVIEEGLFYRFTMRSDEMEAYLLLYGVESELVSENDDMNDGTTDAEIALFAESSGIYTVVATTYDSGEVGSFVFEAVAFELEVIFEEELVFAETNRADDRCRYFRDFEIDGRDGWLVIEMKSDEVDSYLELYDASGERLTFNDDHSPDVFHARIVYATHEGEVYRVRATTYSESETGEFSLTISTGE